MSEVISPKREVEVTVTQWVQRGCTVTVEAGPEDDVERLAAEAARATPDSDWDTTDSDYMEFDYEEPGA